VVEDLRVLDHAGFFCSRLRRSAASTNDQPDGPARYSNDAPFTVSHGNLY